MGVVVTYGRPLTPEELARVQRALKRRSQVKLLALIGVKQSGIFRNALRGRNLSDYARQRIFEAVGKAEELDRDLIEAEALDAKEAAEAPQRRREATILRVKASIALRVEAIRSRAERQIRDLEASEAEMIADALAKKPPRQRWTRAERLRRRRQEAIADAMVDAKMVVHL